MPLTDWNYQPHTLLQIHEDEIHQMIPMIEFNMAGELKS